MLKLLLCDDDAIREKNDPVDLKRFSDMMISKSICVWGEVHVLNGRNR